MPDASQTLARPVSLGYTAGMSGTRPSNSTLRFAFVLHNHQPVGNLDRVFRQAFEQAYLPFVEVVEDFPELQIVLHYTGPLLEWLEAERHEFIDRLRALALTGQAEILTGGFYEPILSAIPTRDRLGQIRRMTGWVEDNLGVHPRGLWLAERVWEPHLARDLADAGAEYCLIDDAPFERIGIPRDALHGYYITEEEGRMLRVVPIDSNLRALIPFRVPKETEAYLREVAAGGPCRLATFADDGEKLGDWPGTHRWVYEEGYLRDLFAMVGDNAGWLQTTTLSRFLDDAPALGTAYVPAASYAEMLEWSGGFWRNFLRRYPESNQMHKRMQRVIAKVEAMPPDSPDRAVAQAELYRGQCNCPYWHGAFGGIYLLHLRHANYAGLLRAERLADATARGDRAWQEMTIGDLDYDGNDEVLVDGRELAAVVAPANGGHLIALSAKREAHNLLATLSRRPEAYHERLASGEGAPATEARRVREYDWYLRQALVDHFLAPGTTPEQFRSGQCGELGDFVDRPYRVESAAGSPAEIVLVRDGHVWEGSVHAPLRIEKRLRIDDAERRLSVCYALSSDADVARRLWFAVEWNLSMTGGAEFGRFYRIDGEQEAARGLASMGQRQEVRGVELVDEWLGLMVELETFEPAETWWQPLETVSQGVERVDLNYQASTVVLSYHIELPARGEWRCEISLALRAVPRTAARSPSPPRP